MGESPPATQTAPTAAPVPSIASAYPQSIARTNRHTATEIGMVAAIDNARTALSTRNEMPATPSRQSKRRPRCQLATANATGHPPEPGNRTRQRSSDQVTQTVGTTLGGGISERDDHTEGVALLEDREQCDLGDRAHEGADADP